MLHLVEKLVKQHPNISLQLHKKVQNLIVSVINSKKYTLDQKILHIDELLTNYKRPLSTDRQDYIANKLTSLLVPIINKNQGFRILDIGGGNGYILSYLGNKFGLKKENLICLENCLVGETEFCYKFNMPNITYCFDPKQLTNNNNTFDLVICMVSLHHMSDDYINYCIMPLINSGKYLLIKEHDTNNNEEVKQRIDWEHHLYHILETTTFLTPQSIKKYLNSYIGNYKSKEEYESLFSEYQLINTYNNLLENGCINSVTRLFWQLYKKKQDVC